MTWYIGIRPQEPADLGPDDSGRCVYGLNVEAFSRPSALFIEDLLQVLEDAGIGLREVDLFGTSSAAIPEGDGPYVLVLAGQGSGNRVRTKNAPPNTYVRPRARVLAVAQSAAIAEATAYRIYDAMDAVRNQEVTPA